MFAPLVGLESVCVQTSRPSVMFAPLVGLERPGGGWF